MPNANFPNPQFHARPSPTVAARARVRARTQRHHPGAPAQLDHGVEEGFLRAPRPAETRRIGRFSTGMEQSPPSGASRSPETRRIGRFSTGMEQLPPSGRKGRFSEGAEHLLDTPQKTVERRFSQGIEHKVVR